MNAEHHFDLELFPKMQRLEQSIGYVDPDRCGWYEVSSGYYSCVYFHDEYPDVALKVGRLYTDGYAAFAMYCMGNPSPFLPTIYRCKTTKDNNVLTLMKKYSPLPKFEHNFCWYMEKEARCQWNALSMFIPKKNYDHVNGPQEGDVIDVQLAMDMAQAFMGVRDFFKGICSFDLHAENIMWDEEAGHIVLTDPIHCLGEVEVDRIVSEFRGCMEIREHRSAERRSIQDWVNRQALHGLFRFPTEDEPVRHVQKGRAPFNLAGFDEVFNRPPVVVHQDDFEVAKQRPAPITEKEQKQLANRLKDRAGWKCHKVGGIHARA